MEVLLKMGVAGLKFGMKQKDVEAALGKPDRQYKDEDKNVIYLYNSLKLRLTFYEDEDYRFGYFITSNTDSKLLSENVIGKDWEAVQANVQGRGIKTFEKELFDSVENYFNEANWVIFQVEYGQVIRVEAGAIINDKDEFDWKFKA